MHIEFLKAYHQMTREHATAFKQECIAHFGWHPTTFYKKLNNEFTFRPNELRDLVRIMNKYLNNPNL